MFIFVHIELTHVPMFFSEFRLFNYSIFKKILYRSPFVFILEKYYSIH